MSKRAILYTRVSTDEQAEKGYSLPTQLAACQKYAEAQGFTVAATFADDYTGSVPIEYRPAGKQAYEMLKSGEANALICYAVDRLVRPPEEGDEWDTPILIRGLAKLGKELHVCNRGRLGTNFGELLLALLEAKSAGDERRKIVERTVRGKVAKAQAGKWVGGGRVTYGYSKEGAKKTARLVIDPDKAEVVRRIFDMYLGRNGHKKMPLRQISASLMASGVQSPLKSKGWYPSTLKKLLVSKLYIGVVSYMGHETHFPELAIIDGATFEAAQRQRERNRQTYHGPRKRDYLLTGHLRCRCGRRMAGANVNKYGYYVCNRHTEGEHMKNALCHERMIRSPDADAAVWEWVTTILANAQRLESGLKELAATRAAETETQRARLAEADELLAHVEGKIRRLAASIAETDNATALEALRAELATQGKRKEELSAKREAIAAEVSQGELTKADRERIKGFAALIRSRLKDAPTFDEKREMLELLDLHAEPHESTQGRCLAVTCAITPGESAILMAYSPWIRTRRCCRTAPGTQGRAPA
ncbi:MAG: recombinase family protein [Chloroflexi bacterium]|nr:recombinase family protein [Chloroflexota bacterium]